MQDTLKLSDFPNAPDKESSTRDYQSRFDGKVGRWLLARQESLTLRAVERLEKELGRKLKILDVGGGHAQNVDILSSAGHELIVLGSDADAGLLVKEKQSQEKGHDKVHYQEGSLVAIPFADDTFDLVISYRILAHIENWQTYLAELARVSSQGVLVDYPCYESVNILSSLFYQMKNKVEKNTRYYRVFYKSQVRKQCALTDLRLDKSWGQFVAPMALHRALKSVPLSAFIEGVLRGLMLSKFFASPLIELYRKK